MLYKKNTLPFSIDEFKNPSSEYRGAPFWAWNTKLEKDELLRQIEVLKKMGFGGFHIHVRTGMATEYLSDEYMELVGACVKKAREENMLCWLYDEDRWPSGAAGGFLTKNEKYRIRHLLLTRHPYGTEGEPSLSKRNRTTSGRTENGILIACFDVVLDENGDIESYKRITKSEIDNNEKAKGIKLFAYAETALPSAWFNNQTYANTLDAETIKEFIKITHERYKSCFAKDFGGVIPAIFTDEPQFSLKGTLNFALEDADVTLPWTSDIEDTFKAEFNGTSLVDGLPELLWELSSGRVSQIRYRYHDHIAARFAEAFASQCGAWCKENGIMLTGHMMEEPTLESQTAALGEAMRSYRYFGLPGIDMLCDWHEYTTAKQAASAARQNGVPGILSELYGVTNWDFDFRRHKLQGDWQAALGVVVRVPHLSWVSMNGEAKRDYPAVFNYQAPWHTEYSFVEDHFARAAYVMTRGAPVVHVGVIHPIESYWLHWGAREKTADIREEMDMNFKNLCDWLLRGLIDFDYIGESNLDFYCPLSDISDSFPVGKMRYQVLIVPALETMRLITYERLTAFREKGGRIIFLGGAPKYIDAIPDKRPKKLFEACEHIAFERLPVLASLSDIRDIEIRGSRGGLSRALFYQIREEKSENNVIRHVFIAHADNPENPDMSAGDIITIKIKGLWKAALLDTINGEMTAQDAKHSGGWAIIACPLYEHDSLLFRLENCLENRKELPQAEPQTLKLLTETLSGNGRAATPIISERVHFTSPVPVTLHEENVLLLDMAEYALDDEPYRKCDEILRIDNTLRGELGWPQRSDGIAQPWVGTDVSTPHTLALRYSFESCENLEGCYLALENAAKTKASLNGENAAHTNEWYVDKCIGKVKLPPVKKGCNILELAMPYGKQTDVEAAYLLGDFAVTVTGTKCTLQKGVRSLAFGDISRQGLPFYGGNLTYHLEAESMGGSLTITASNYRGHLLKVSVDGKDCGIIAYSPYRLELKGLSDGMHKIDIHYFGSRINTFGQLHCVDRSNGHWWGPNSWRGSGAEWSDEYCFWPQGVLKSPEIT